MLAILQFVSGIQLLVASVTYFFLVSWASTSEGVEELTKAGAWALKNAGSIFLILGIVYLLLGIGSLVLARGYLRGREWARHRGRMVAALAILFSFVGGFFLPQRLDAGSPLWTIVFNVIVILYLGSKKVRRFFSK